MRNNKNKSPKQNLKNGSSFRKQLSQEEEG